MANGVTGAAGLAISGMTGYGPLDGTELVPIVLTSGPFGASRSRHVTTQAFVDLTAVRVGPTGGVGPPGTSIQGPTGATGHTGPQGFIGQTGAAGIQGNLGQTGPAGPPGIGLTGTAGQLGPTGMTGATGAQGSI